MHRQHRESGPGVVRRAPLEMVGAMTCAILFFLGLYATPASAYTTWGCKWDHKNITYMAPSPYASSPIWINAAGKWTGVDATLTSASSSYDIYAMNENRGNTVVWSAVLRKKGTIEARPSCSSAGYMTSGQVEVVLNWSYLQHWTSTQQQGSAAHEFGHAFGLGHVTSNNLLMYEYASRTVATPQSDDKAGVNALY